MDEVNCIKLSANRRKFHFISREYDIFVKTLLKYGLTIRKHTIVVLDQLIKAIDRFVFVSLYLLIFNYYFDFIDFFLGIGNEKFSGWDQNNDCVMT